jgi:hypothetical protein
MGRKEKKYHYIYKTTNVKNDKFYIGMHSTDNLNDGYMGSGKRLWHSINYHGKDNHVCEILEYCKDRKELKILEKEIVNDDLLNEDLCMNLVVGGEGGFISLEGTKRGAKITNTRHKDKLSEWRAKGGAKSGAKNLKQLDWTGKKHSEKTKLKMRKPKNKGEANSQFGSCWITNEKENRKIMRGDSIPEGWRLGRKMKINLGGLFNQ